MKRVFDIELERCGKSGKCGNELKIIVCFVSHIGRVFCICKKICFVPLTLHSSAINLRVRRKGEERKCLTWGVRSGALSLIDIFFQKIRKKIY